MVRMFFLWKKKKKMVRMLKLSRDEFAFSLNSHSHSVAAFLLGLGERKVWGIPLIGWTLQGVFSSE